MGYESRLYVVEKNHYNIGGEMDKDNPLSWAEKIAAFDLCKCGSVANKMLKYPATSVYIYADDGNTKITEDNYGDPLREIPIEDAIAILEDAAKEDDYRRFAPLIGLLKGFNTVEWNELVVLHFGY